MAPTSLPPREGWRRIPARWAGWRAWHTFASALAAAFVCFVAFLASALALRARGPLSAREDVVLLGLLRYGTYPLVFLALGALLWHYIRFYRGDYARR